MHRNHSIVACSCHGYMGVVLRAHSVRGEPRIQRNASGEVATLPLQQGQGHPLKNTTDMVAFRKSVSQVKATRAKRQQLTTNHFAT